jgi:hypothetical protein
MKCHLEHYLIKKHDEILYDVMIFDMMPFDDLMYLHFSLFQLVKCHFVNAIRTHVILHHIS